MPIENLNPDVLMMEPAEDRYRCDAAELLGGDGCSHPDPEVAAQIPDARAERAAGRDRA